MRKLETTFMKKGFWKKLDEQETLDRLKIKIETEKLE